MSVWTNTGHILLLNPQQIHSGSFHTFSWLSLWGHDSFLVLHPEKDLLWIFQPTVGAPSLGFLILWSPPSLEGRREVKALLIQLFFAPWRSLARVPFWCSSSWILHLASTIWSLVLANSCSCSLIWALRDSFSWSSLLCPASLEASSSSPRLGSAVPRPSTAAASLGDFRTAADSSSDSTARRQREQAFTALFKGGA